MGRRVNVVPEPRLVALASEDTVLYTRVWEPSTHPVASLVVAHGLAEHAGRYGRLADVMNDAGVAVYAADHRGHGRTAASPEELGFFADRAGWAKVVADLGVVVGHAQELHPGTPVFLLGHSMGSLLARCYAIDYSEQLSGLMLSGTLSDPGISGVVGFGLARGIASLRGNRYRSPLLRRLGFGGYNRAFRPNRTAFDWLSRDEAVVDAYIADPLCGFSPTAGLYADLLGGLRRASRRDQVARVRPELPVLIAAGERDPVASRVTTVVALLRRAGVRDVTLRVYPGARHEICNETNADEVLRDLSAWLQERLI